MTASSHLLCPEALQLVLQPSAEPQLQHFPLLARRLQLTQRALQPLHLLHVGPLPLQLFLQLPVAGLCRGQTLLQQLSSPLALLSGDVQELDLPLQALTLSLLLLF